jgi:thermostable 8-oxoguanine DNA glycosylase
VIIILLYPIKPAVDAKTKLAQEVRKLVGTDVGEAVAARLGEFSKAARKHVETIFSELSFCV